jgi:hypothetical protein
MAHLDRCTRAQHFSPGACRRCRRVRPDQPAGALFLLNRFEILNYELYPLAGDGLWSRISACRILASTERMTPDRLFSAAVGGNRLASIEDSGHLSGRKVAAVLFRKLRQIGRLWI